MKKVLFAVLAVCVSVGAAIAVPPGKDLEFPGSNMGKVTFSGSRHADKGKKCNDCHPEIFQMKHGTAKIKFDDHITGEKFCFACHNGTVAYKPAGDCQKCHKK